MLMLGVPVLLVVFYISIVIGSYKKLTQNGIHLKGKVKFFFPLVPLVIFVFHFLWSLKTLNKDPKFSLQILKLAVFRYPVVIGLIIELMLEKIAFELSQQDKVVRIKRRKPLKKAVQKRGPISLENLQRKQTRSLLKDYQNTVLGASVS